MIRSVQIEDAVQIASIYNYYVENSIATFELTNVELAEMAKRIKHISRLFPFVVFEVEGEILGYAYASDWKARKAYRNTVESSVYLHPNSHGKGIGTNLYVALLNELKAKNIHAVIGGISLPNEPSIRLHEKLGFEKIGQFKEVGWKFDKWIDVGYWELVF